MLDIGSVVLLSDNKKYIVASKASLDGRVYYLLVNYNNEKGVKICTETGENGIYYLDEIDGSNVTKELMNNFAISTKGYLRKDNNNVNNLVAKTTYIR